MSNPKPPSPPPQSSQADCPRVVDLILYALGQSDADERRHVETHLRDAQCRDCRRWLDQAGRVRAEQCVSGRWGLDASAAMRSAAFNTASPWPPARSHVPAPGAPWQQDAFRDLERRLSLLDESARGTP